MTKTGRPTKLTPELQKQICDLIRWGNYCVTVCAFCGICKSTFYKWLKKAKQHGESPYVEFAQAVEQAVAEAEIRDLRNIRLCATVDWFASAWILERRHREKYGRINTWNKKFIHS
jgi:transposase